VGAPALVEVEVAGRILRGRGRIGGWQNGGFLGRFWSSCGELRRSIPRETISPGFAATGAAHLDKPACVAGAAGIFRLIFHRSRMVGCRIVLSRKANDNSRSSAVWTLVGEIA